jgi:hypothetical protein
MNPTASRIAVLMGTASLLTIANAISVHAQGQQVAQEELPENVLITGSLIHGTVAVGTPVTTLGGADYTQVGALTTADVLKSVPSVYVLAGYSTVTTGGNFIAAQDTRIHNIGGDPTGPKTMLMIDGKRVPFTSTALCLVDPRSFPQLFVDHTTNDGA